MELAGAGHHLHRQGHDEGGQGHPPGPGQEPLAQVVEVPEPQPDAQHGRRREQEQEPPLPGQPGGHQGPQQAGAGDDPQPGPAPVEQEQGGDRAHRDQGQSDGGHVGVEHPELSGQVAQAELGRGSRAATLVATPASLT